MPGTNLTREEAATRATLVRVERYDVTLDLTTSEETFATTSTITFACTQPGAETFVDFIGESVEAITLNGTSLDPAEHYADSRVRVPGLAAENVLTIEATGRYMNTGEGLHRFVDPVDDEVYLYSQFEVPDSRRMYPVFEQPDLKASFAFTVTGPAHWQVISNSPQTGEPTPVRDGVARWSFAPTQRISSYITALVAGPYTVVRDSVSSAKGEVPLGLYCRASLAEHLDAEELFALTKQGFAFFEAEFGQPYPFEKYDQVFTPEYNMGAMENAGCVTFNEIYVFRSKVTESLVERRALTLLHELAHMWFGNLVTMRWWDDLWLNESFAEWASTTCQAEATRWTEAWTTFATHEKAWAYRQDQLSSTHPIVAPIRDLHDVEVNFDGITYAKGASVLKQLVAYVGREPFVAGLRAYFAKHAWGNTTLDDLLTELEVTSGRDLRSWSAAWLETSGVNTLRPVVEVDTAGLVTSAVVEQSPAAVGDPTLRPHRIAVGAYDLVDGVLRRSARIELDVDGERTEVPELVGRQQPDLLLVNDDDLAYAKVRLDERSLATFRTDPTAFEDTLPRSLALASAWDMTRDAEMGAREYIDIALRCLDGLDDSTLLKTLLAQISTATATYTAPEHRDETRRRVVRTLGELAERAAPGSDAQLQLVGAHAGALAPGDDAALVAGLLDGSRTLDGLAVDTDMRWTLLTGLVAAGAAGDAEVDAELGRDATLTGRERAARARSSAATPEAKERAWTEATTREDLPNTVLDAIGVGFGRAADGQLLAPFVERYFRELLAAAAQRTHAIAELLLTGFYPFAAADRALLDATQAWLDDNPDAPAGGRRLIAENRDAVARALAAQERDAR